MSPAQVVMRTVVCALVTALTAACAAGVPEAGPLGSPSAAPSPSSPPAPSPEEPATPPRFTLFPGTHYGETYRLEVEERGRDPECRMIYFVRGGHYSAAASSHCTSWDRPLYFFWVELGNRSSKPIAHRLGDFTLIDKQGRRYAPVLVREDALVPANFLPPGTRLRRGESVAGYLTFETERKLVPTELSYGRGRSRATIRFKGRFRSVPVGGVIRS